MQLSPADKSWTLPYNPRELMVEFHQRTQRYAFLICHRRYGKTVACIAELVLRALYTKKKNAQYAYVCPFRSQAKAVAWNYLVDMTQGIAEDVKVSELSVTLPNGAKYGSVALITSTRCEVCTSTAWSLMNLGSVALTCWKRSLCLAYWTEKVG